MPKRQILSDLIVTAKERYNDGVKALFGTNENWSVRSDGTDLIFEEEGTGEVLRINTGNNVADELASSGSTPIGQGTLNPQDPTAHATDHENGGVDEITVTGLSGDLADAQDPKTHAATHSQGNTDPVTVENLAATSTDTSLFFGPDGSGGVSANSPSGTTQSGLESRLLIGDDFADNTLENRDGASTTSSTLANLATWFRPDWQVQSNGGNTIGATTGRYQMTTDGNAQNDRAGARFDIGRPGKITIQFNDVSYSNNGGGTLFGITSETDMTTAVNNSADGIMFRNTSNNNDELRVVAGGTGTSTTFTNLDWTANHDITIVFRDGGEAELSVDGSVVATDSSNPVPSDYGVFGAVFDGSNTQDTTEFESITVDR